jgi:hypothetical protein
VHSFLKEEYIMSIDSVIIKIEDRLKELIPFGAGVPGTTITRVMNMFPKSGYHWSLAIGPMSCPKVFFEGDTIEQCVIQAEKMFLDPTLTTKIAENLFFS